MIDRLCIFLMLNVMSCIVLSSVITQGIPKDMHYGVRVHHAKAHVEGLVLKIEEISGVLAASDM